MGLRQLAYPINKKSSGVYYCIEFKAPSGTVISKTELAFRRDERIMRFLTARLDKYGVQYNEDRRNGKISAYKRKESKKKVDGRDDAPVRHVAPAPIQAPVAPPAPAPVAIAEEE